MESINEEERYDTVGGIRDSRKAQTSGGVREAEIWQVGGRAMAQNGPRQSRTEGPAYGSISQGGRSMWV